MTSPKKLVLILGDQLDLESTALADFDAANDQILMVESIHEAQYVWSHQAKIALFISAMRHFARALKDLNYPLTYIRNSNLSIIGVLKEKILQDSITHLVCVEPGEWRLKQEILELTDELHLQLDMREDKHFFCTQKEFQEWAANKKELRLEYFYRLMRKTHNILIDADGNPEGGQWNFDQDNRKPYPKKDLASLMTQSCLSLMTSHKKLSS